MLSNEFLRQIARGTNNEYVFDFSIISSENYEPLFRTLQKFCINNVDSLGFSCDAITSYANNPNKMPTDILKSIAKNKKSYIRNMVELLCYCVPKSSKITELVFSNLQIAYEYLARMSGSFARSKSLIRIVFRNCSIDNPGIEAMFRSLDPNKIESITIQNCNLTNQIIPSAIAFAQRKSVQEGGITTINLDGNNLAQSDLLRLNQALSPLPKKTVQSIPRPFLDEVAPEEFSDEASFPDSNMNAVQAEIAALKSENQMLRNQIKALREMKASSEMNGSIFVVGTGAPQFVSYLGEVEEKLLSIDQNTKFM